MVKINLNLEKKTKRFNISLKGNKKPDWKKIDFGNDIKVRFKSTFSINDYWDLTTIRKCSKQD